MQTYKTRDYDEGQWMNLEAHLAEKIDPDNVPLGFTLDFTFDLAEKLLYKFSGGAFHFDVGWDWNFQAYLAHITVANGNKYVSDSSTPVQALLLALELWLEKTGNL